MGDVREFSKDQEREEKSIKVIIETMPNGEEGIRLKLTGFDKGLLEAMLVLEVVKAQMIQQMTQQMGRIVVPQTPVPPFGGMRG